MISSANASSATAESKNLGSQLSRQFGSPTYQPPVLPKIALEVHALTHRSDITFREVVDTLAMDPLLAGGVLSRAQSAIFTARIPPRTLLEAVRRLGLRTTRDIVWEIALRMRVFVAPGYVEPVAALTRHSAITAHLCRTVCARAGLEMPHAFLCGLLHNVGLLASLVLVTEMFDFSNLPAVTDIATGLEPLHEEAGGQLARIWGLGEEIQRGVEQHHHPRSLEGYLVCLASTIAAEECGTEELPRIEEHDTDLIDAARVALGLSDADLEALRMDAVHIGTVVR
ncbi:MAG: HDOD domain-containing protein [Myxococcota bacterium]